jgi:hypothetical protein
LALPLSARATDTAHRHSVAVVDPAMRAMKDQTAAWMADVSGRWGSANEAPGPVTVAGPVVTGALPEAVEEEVGDPLALPDGDADVVVGDDDWVEVGPAEELVALGAEDEAVGEVAVVSVGDAGESVGTAGLLAWVAGGVAVAESVESAWATDMATHSQMAVNAARTAATCLRRARPIPRMTNKLQSPETDA